MECRLTLLEDLGKGRGLYQCSCGNQKEMLTKNVDRGLSKSCGCWNIEAIKIRSTTHGYSAGNKTRTYKCWLEMRRRCVNPKRKCYKHYGGRDIQVCERWLASFENFLEDMGECPENLTLDRIDVNGNYEPSNCRWATMTEQANNKRNNRKLEAFGRCQTLQEWAKETGLTRGCIRKRIESGWSAEDALTTPSRLEKDKIPTVQYEPFPYPC